jgi:hypothetical protein
MARFHTTSEGHIPFTPEEEMQRDAEEAAWAASANDRAAAEHRMQRDSLLTASDWTQASDISQATKDKWATYRQALRDVPQQDGFPNTVVWPNQPG